MGVRDSTEIPTAAELPADLDLPDESTAETGLTFAADLEVGRVRTAKAVVRAVEKLAVVR